MTSIDLPRAEAAHPADLITVAADCYGAQPAFTVVQPDGSAQDISFAEADRLSDAFAGFLIEKLALSPGDVVAVQLANGLFFPIAVFGAWKAGLIVTPINPFYTAVETRRQLADSGARALVADVSALDQLAKDDLSALALIAVDGPLLPSTRAVPTRLSDRPSMDGNVAAGQSNRYSPTTRHPRCLGTPRRCTNTPAARPGGARRRSSPRTICWRRELSSLASSRRMEWRSRTERL